MEDFWQVLGDVFGAFGNMIGINFADKFKERSGLDYPTLRNIISNTINEASAQGQGYLTKLDTAFNEALNKLESKGYSLPKNVSTTLRNIIIGARQGIEKKKEELNKRYSTARKNMLDNNAKGELLEKEANLLVSDFDNKSYGDLVSMEMQNKHKDVVQKVEDKSREAASEYNKNAVELQNFEKEL